ncbi:MAG: hypothetical protein CMB99_03915 [Flavobacteriaceae bacterium]|nr:hypothetical protein [Flavobacteriaceae bacterium]|tara:strand:+ start:66486 stop:68093 length:1608 start_codon:yes stop_codon:yes gene_type:complete
MPYLDAYQGSWTEKEIRHLLRRTTYGATQSMVSECLGLGLQSTIDKLFEDLPEAQPPLKYQFDGNGRDQVNDPDADYGETWVNGDPVPNVGSNQEQARIINARKRSLYAWSFLQMTTSHINIREKLTHFWHNHFVAVNQNPHIEYYYYKLIQSQALGNFIQLTKDMTINPNMLLYLSGALNSKFAPNENYSRELLELFTVGKGVDVGQGDYTNYTEDDVVEMAKALTGWRVQNAVSGTFIPNRHTEGTKTLSHRFNNAELAENGEDEYKDLIDLIFQQDECSRFITRQLYKWFVKDVIDADIETNIIEPLAKIIRENNYEIVPALKVLFASQHFYENVFCMVKSPIDLIMSGTKSLLLSNPTTSVKDAYEYAYVLYLVCNELEQGLFNHPDVAGWKAYYQEPLFYKTWINNYLLPKRMDYCKVLVTGGSMSIDNVTFDIPPLIPVFSFIADINNSIDPNVLIRELANRMFNYPISDAQLENLKEILIPGLPDFEWTVEYGDYLNNPGDNALRISVENKLRNLIGTMVQMSEFQIM